MVDACGIKGPTLVHCLGRNHWQGDDHKGQQDVLQLALQVTSIFEFGGQVLEEETGDEDEEHRAIRYQRLHHLILPTAVPPVEERDAVCRHDEEYGDRTMTRLNSSHLVISYAVFCLKKKQ